MDKFSQVVTLRTRETIEQEAADWLAKLDGGNLSHAQRTALRAWLSQDPEHARALKCLAAIWSDMDELLNETPPAQRPGDAGLFSLLFGRRWLTASLATLCLGLVALFVWRLVPMDAPASLEMSFHSTGVGKQQVEQFSDGSSAHLNTDSMIEAEYSASRRIVRLLRGEALFDVTPDPARPFIVYAGDTRVQAIGTRFIVRLTSENIVVTVTDGRVQLSKRAANEHRAPAGREQEVIVVRAGEEVEVDNKMAPPEPKEVQDEELKRRLSWLNGQLVFNNERLEQVIEEISRYVPDQIVIDDPDLRDVLISGRFQIGDTDALLEAIEVSFNVQASHVEGQTIHLTPSIKK